MTSIWERFNEIEGASPDEVQEARSQYEEHEAGQYKVKVELIEATETKQTGLPMVSFRFRVLSGERENSIIFYNQVIQNLQYPNITALNISKVMSLLSGILGENVEFTGLGDLEKLIKSIPNDIKVIIELAYDEAKNGKKYPKVTVVKDIEELDMDSDLDSDDDIPY